MEIERYDSSMKSDWDRFVDNSKNGTFLFKRDYMEYHSDRFNDCSFLFSNQGKIISLLPGCITSHAFISHAGLTYGGLVMNKKTNAEQVLDMFTFLKDVLKKEEINSVVYKPVPYIYSILPAQEDLYALFRNKAFLSARNISSVVDQSERIPFRQIRKYGIRKAGNEGIKIEESKDYEAFWKILTNNLKEKYSAQPVHTLEEIVSLSSLFPNNIKLFIAKFNEEPIAGVVIYLSSTVAHTQYISASPMGKETGALDLLFDHLLNVTFKDTKYFDFGTSNEHGGQYLNQSLIYQKEGFGGRAVCYDTYSFSLM